MNLLNNLKKSKCFAHTIVWAALIIVNYVITKRYDVQINWTETIVSWALYIALFYANYLFLIPRLLFRKHTVSYIATAIVVFGVVFVSIRYTSVTLMKQRIEVVNRELKKYSDIEEQIFSREKEERLRRARQYIEMSEMTRDQRDSMERLGDRGDREIDRAMTPREEQYESLYRENRRFRSFSKGMRHNVYNPVAMHNMPLLYTLLFFYMAGLALAYIDKYRNTEKKRLQMEQEKITTELAYLKQQINPHFLFNTLNSIYSYTIGVSTPASDAIIKLSSILRYMLYETNREKVPLTDEIAVVYDYIDLQKLRLTEKTKVDITITGDPNFHQIEPMLLMPILENAFKYGVDSVEESFVKISIDVTTDLFVFAVSNKIVKKNSADNQNSGIGIKNIRRRLDLMYGDRYSFDVSEKDGIFEVVLRLLML